MNNKQLIKVLEERKKILERKETFSKNKEKSKKLDPREVFKKGQNITLSALLGYTFAFRILDNHRINVSQDFMRKMAAAIQLRPAREDLVRLSKQAKYADKITLLVNKLKRTPLPTNFIELLLTAPIYSIIGGLIFVFGWSTIKGLYEKYKSYKGNKK